MLPQSQRFSFPNTSVGCQHLFGLTWSKCRSCKYLNWPNSGHCFAIIISDVRRTDMGFSIHPFSTLRLINCFVIVDSAWPFRFLCGASATVCGLWRFCRPTLAQVVNPMNFIAVLFWFTSLVQLNLPHPGPNLSNTVVQYFNFALFWWHYFPLKAELAFSFKSGYKLHMPPYKSKHYDLL